MVPVKEPRPATESGANGVFGRRILFLFYCFVVK
jgi:hypothetical protein